MNPLTKNQQRLVEQNTGAAVFHAKKLLRSSPRLRTVPKEDLDGASSLALVRAVATWNPRKGSLSGWIFFYVRLCLYREFGTARLVRLPGWYENNDQTRRSEESYQQALKTMFVFPLSGKIDKSTNQDCPLEKAQVAELWDFASRLAGRQREIIHRHYRLGETLRDISRSMNVSYQRVQQIMRRGLKRLRSLMKEQDYEPG